MNSEYVKYRAVDFLSQILPRPFAYWVGLRMADWFYQHDNRGRHAVMSNLRHILEYKGVHPSEETLERLSQQTFRNFGKYVVDFFRFTQMSRRQVDRVVSIEHQEYISDAAVLGRGVLTVTAHFGSWEIGGLVISALGYPLNVVTLQQTDRRINDLFQSRRKMRGLKVIPLGSAAIGTIKALKKGEFVALLADRDYSQHRDLVQFFGKTARFPRGPATLCIKTGAVLLPGFLLRQPDDTFLLRMHKPIEAENRSISDIQAMICRILEKEIGENPTQWYIFEEFWNGE
ncbi:MAG: lysophospholipid acyltransferase family protein [Kiritimatiellae bacterium]|nr:lysophospholipid acyltransferase family protein [Kiritimatiellia bacterium]